MRPNIPDLFARRVRSMSDERLERTTRGIWRRPLLNAVFRQMPKQFDSVKGADIEAVVDWRIRDAQRHHVDHYQLIIGGGRCRSTRKPDRAPDLTIELDATPFLRLVSGQANGPELFMTGKLKTNGNQGLAMRLPSLFRIPGSK